MTNSEFEYKITRVLLEIHAITGWEIPSNEEILNLFIRQFSIKVVESYFFLNQEEIEYGFRMCGKFVKEWGKNMNIAIIDQVMDLYLKERSEALHGSY